MKYPEKKFVIIYSVDKIYQNPGRNNQGRFLDTISMPGDRKKMIIVAIDILGAQKKFWERRPYATIKNIYPFEEIKEEE